MVETQFDSAITLDDPHGIKKWWENNHVMTTGALKKEKYWNELALGPSSPMRLSEAPLCGAMWDISPLPSGFSVRNGSLSVRRADGSWEKQGRHIFAANDVTDEIFDLTAGQYVQIPEGEDRVQWMLNTAPHLVTPLSDQVIALLGNAEEIEQVLGFRYTWTQNSRS